MDRFVVLLLLLITLSCGSQDVDKKEQKKRLMVRANDKILDYDYDSALFYVNEALVTAKKISRLRNFNNMSLEGMAYENLGKLDKAKELYKTTVDKLAKG